MKKQDQTSPFEEFLEDGSHDEAIRDVKYRRLEKPLRRTVLIILAVIFVCGIFTLGGIFVLGAKLTIEGVVSAIAGYALGFIMVVVGLFFIAMFLSLLLAIIPFEKFDYSQRVTLLFFSLIFLIELIVIIGTIAIAIRWFI